MSESALLPKFFPDPQAISGLGRQWETQLMRQHARLAAMMGIDATRGAVQGFREQLRATLGALRQRNARLLLRAARAIELSGQMGMRSGEPQPFATDVVHMSEYRRDGARGRAGRPCPPSERARAMDSPRSPSGT